jgi:hypothetical protein
MQISQNVKSRIPAECKSRIGLKQKETIIPFNIKIVGFEGRMLVFIENQKYRRS